MIHHVEHSPSAASQASWRHLVCNHGDIRWTRFAQHLEGLAGSDKLRFELVPLHHWIQFPYDAASLLQTLMTHHVV